jgi:hypothetical protein
VPGQISDVAFQPVGATDGNIALRYGTDNDMEFVAAVRGNHTLSTGPSRQNEYWMHPEHNVRVQWTDPNVACFIGPDGQRQYATFDGQRWSRHPE